MIDRIMSLQERLRRKFALQQEKSVNAGVVRIINKDRAEAANRIEELEAKLKLAEDTLEESFQEVHILSSILRANLKDQIGATVRNEKIENGLNKACKQLREER